MGVKTERVEHWKKPAVKSAAKKAPRYYPAEDVKGKLGNHHNTRKQTKLRKSISAGTVVIMLAGHFKGKRVVVLKQLESGLLLVTGPYKLNGVPLRRVPQSYVIATTTQVDVSKVSIPAEVNDDLFKSLRKPTRKMRMVSTEMARRRTPLTSPARLSRRLLTPLFCRALPQLHFSSSTCQRSSA